MPLLDIKNLETAFHTGDGVVRAVDGVDLAIEAGSAVGIVGESGSGKSVLNLSILGLIPSPPGIVRADRIEFEGKDLRKIGPEALRRIRGNRIAMIFQDPMTSLNPFLTIGEQIEEPLCVHKGMDRRKARGRAVELLREVGIPDPERCLRAYPQQFSGGMRQRAMIAMAIACEPALLIADEPTTALDVTIQAQILELLRRLRESHGTAVILITHDLGVAAGFCESIHVLYAGRIVEQATARELFSDPAHPYTRALIASVPRLDDETRGRFSTIAGSPPDLTRLPPGCAFAPRCGHVLDRCRERAPALLPHRGGARKKACFVELGRPDG